MPLFKINNNNKVGYCYYNPTLDLLYLFKLIFLLLAIVKEYLYYLNIIKYQSINILM